MIKFIDIKMLYTNICQLGPYIYYFNHDCNGLDVGIIQLIKYWSLKYKDLNILQINNDPKNSQKIKGYEKDAKKIFLYYEGYQITYINEPNVNDIKNIIYECIAFYNRKLLKLAANVNIGNKKGNYKNNYQDLLSEIYKKRSIPNVRHDISRYLRKQIKIPDNQIAIKYFYDNLLFENGLALLEQYKYKTTPSKINQTDLINNIDYRTNKIIDVNYHMIKNISLKLETDKNVTTNDKDSINQGKFLKRKIKYKDINTKISLHQHKKTPLTNIKPDTIDICNSLVSSQNNYYYSKNVQKIPETNYTKNYDNITPFKCQTLIPSLEVSKNEKYNNDQHVTQVETNDNFLSQDDTQWLENYLFNDWPKNISEK